MEENTEKRVDLTLFSEKIQELKDRIASVIVGQEQMVDLVLTAVLANGHVLIEGVREWRKHCWHAWLPVWSMQISAASSLLRI